MEATKIREILDKHKLWLETEDDGECADFGGADLSYADLYYADLRCADLSYADLSGANLHHANLRHAELRRADLRRAYLGGADLSGANIDFSAWPLWCGSLDVKVDKRIIAQLAYHFCSLVCVDDDDTVKEAFLQARAVLLPLANQFHRTDVPSLE